MVPAIGSTSRCPQQAGLSASAARCQRQDWKRCCASERGGGALGEFESKRDLGMAAALSVIVLGALVVVNVFQLRAMRATDEE